MHSHQSLAGPGLGVGASAAFRPSTPLVVRNSYLFIARLLEYIRLPSYSARAAKRKETTTEKEFIFRLQASGADKSWRHDDSTQRGKPFLLPDGAADLRA